MGLFIQQNDNRSKLQERLETELREKAKAKANVDSSLPDGVDDSNYVKDMKQTTSLAWVWVLIILFIVIGVITFIVTGSQA